MRIRALAFREVVALPGFACLLVLICATVSTSLAAPARLPSLRSPSSSVPAFSNVVFAPAQLYVRVCEAHLLYARRCQAGLRALPASGPDWQHLAMVVAGQSLSAGEPLILRIVRAEIWE